MSHVIHRGGTALDHIALAFPDTRDGVAYVSDLTGIDIPVLQPRPDEWFWSASVSFGEGRLLEILGPNPDVPPDNPFGELLPILAEPQLLFWYVGVTNLDAFVADLGRSGHTAMGVVDVTDPPVGFPAYRRGIIGPDYSFVRPMFIEWIHPPEGIAVGAEFEAFTIETSKPDALRDLFGALGVEQDVVAGSNEVLRLTLRTPKGGVELSGGWPPKTRRAPSPGGDRGD